MGKSVKTVALIGAGQLGSRHLQSLAKIDIQIKLQVVDPNEDALRIAKTRYKEIPENENINGIDFYHKTDDLNEDIDLCIIATNADVRFKVFEQFTSKKNVSNIIFEKIVFQSDQDFYEASRLLLQKNISCWVNCPRRMYPIYNKIKEILASDKNIIFQISGGDWGMACNAIHFIDLLAFFSLDTAYKLNIDGLDYKVWKSKRKGFKEITGKIIGYFSNGSRIDLVSTSGSDANTRISINNSQVKALIYEARGTANISKRKECWKEEIKKFKVPFQSELTHLAAKEILESGTCKLTEFNESSLLHLPLLEAIKKHFEIVEDKKYDYCPIT